MNTKKEYERWLKNATADTDIAVELKTLDDTQIEDAFYRDLTFGTGGLRGVIGAGTNRMNVYTVAKASQGLADYLKKNFTHPSVSIGYDSRIKSEMFAKVAAGVFAAEQVQSRYRFARKLHWRQGILLCEILILFIVGFVPTTLNMLATTLVSFACAMQVQTFRKVSGYSYASTMCIGNLRSGTAALSVYFREHKKDQLRQSLYYFGIILFFAIGAGIGGNLSAHYGLHTIWISDGLLCISFVLMFIERLG